MRTLFLNVAALLRSCAVARPTAALHAPRARCGPRLPPHLCALPLPALPRVIKCCRDDPPRAVLALQELIFRRSRQVKTP